jgi:hypothetical protein
MSLAKDEYVEMLRKTHRDNPNDFFEELLEKIWMNRDEDQAFREWKRLCDQVYWYAEDAVGCLEHILANPPANLVELMQERGWILLDHGTARYTLLKPYREKYVAWLVDMTDQFKNIYAAHTRQTS